MSASSPPSSPLPVRTPPPTAIIKLQSSDGRIFETDIESTKCMGTLKTMLANVGITDAESTLIPIPMVNSRILRKVLTWANYHKHDPELAVEERRSYNGQCRNDLIPKWDADFLNVDQSTLFELILAANYLDIKGLTNVASQTVANMIKGNTPEQIRQKFNIENDFQSGEF